MLYTIRDIISLYLGVQKIDESYQRGLLTVDALDFKGKRVGYCWVTRPKNSQILKLADIIVEKDWRSKGTGTLLMQRTLNWARRLKARKIEGYITASDFKETPWVIEWYRSFGFRILPPVAEDHSEAICRLELDLV